MSEAKDPGQDLEEIIDEFEQAWRKLEASRELLEERRRAVRIAKGLDPDPPHMTIEAMRAATIRMRAANDQADAERQGRWRTFD